MSEFSYAVAAFDAAGNVSGQSATAQATTFSPDITPPVVSLRVQGPSGANVNANDVVAGNLTFTVSASDPVVPNQVTSGVASVTLTLDGSTVATSAGSALTLIISTRSLLNVGHTVVATARDNAGNVGSSATFLLKEIGFQAGWQ